MIRNTQVLWPTLGAVLLSVTLAGCDGSAPGHIHNGHHRADRSNHNHQHGLKRRREH
jgi:hypothetical protein